MHSLDLILTLTGGLVAALVFGYLTQRVGLSPIVGYLLAGLVVGPNTPGFVANKHLADQLAEVGVILLMFGVGVQFHLKELLEVRRIAIPGALGQILVATGLGYVIGTAMNWGWAAGTVFGLAISVASTVVLLRVLADNNDLHTPTGHIAVGWLVVEDLFTVLVLVLLPVVFGSGDAPSANVPLALVLAVAKLGVLVVFTLAGRRPAHSLGSRARGQNEFEGAVHSDHPCPGFGHRGDVRQTLWRFDGYWRLPCGHGRGAFRLQPTRGLRSSCRCGMRLPCCFLSLSECSLTQGTLRLHRV